MFSLASVGTIAACLFIFGLFFFLVSNFENMMKSAEAGVGITVFFEDGLSDGEKKAIGSKIAARKEVEKQTEKIKLECERAIAQNYHRLWVIALRDEFGFGKDRLKRALEKVIELSNDLSDKRFNFDDIAEVIKDETGLEV